MANLTNEEVQRLFRERPRKKEIDIGVNHQDRLRFHTETVITKDQLSPYYRTYENWILSNKPELLPEDKRERFKQLLTVPLPTIELTESIFSHLGNVFKAQDMFCRYDFTDPSLNEDWKEYLDCDFWQTQGFQAMQNAIDSVWIVDLSDNKERPEPKDRLINISNVIDIQVDINNKCEYIIFSLGDKVFVYDEVKFMTYQLKDKQISPLPESEIPHNLGYTPARMFWSDQLLTKNYINKKAPLTNVLGDLDWLLTCQVFKKYMEIANSYPVLAAYEASDDYMGSKQEENRGTPKELQDTKGAPLPGPGSIMTVPPPRAAGEVDLMTNPLKYINPDVNTLTFHVGEISLKRDNIFYSVVGKGGEQNNDQAKNEKQVQASFESQTSILMKIAKNFEAIQTFADKCKADLRYGVGVLKSLSIDYGSRFFMKTTTDLINELETAANSHPAIKSTLMDEINETKFRNDSYGMERARIIQELDPLPDKSQEEAEKILDKKGITLMQFIIKSQLMNFVKRFEREQASLVEFGSAIDYGKKIAGIYEEFESYAEEIIGKEPELINPPVNNNKPPVNEIGEEVSTNIKENELSNDSGQS